MSPAIETPSGSTLRPLTGRQVLVTGASRGLGAEVARACARAGADLYLVARSSSALEAVVTSLMVAPTQRVVWEARDLSTPASGAELVRVASARMGGLTTVVNNAAVQGPVGPIDETPWDEWEAAFQTNFLVPAAICREAVGLLPSGGTIINVSGGGATGPRPRFSSYGAAKAALVRLSETLAYEVRGRGVSIVCIAPGAMKSAMTDAVLEAGPALAGTDEYAQAMKIAASGEGVAERAAALCVYLAHADAAVLSGRLLSAVWDPWESLWQHRDALAGSDVFTLRRIVPSDRGLAW